MTATSAGPTLGHHKLHNRYRFVGRFRLASPLRLSSGRASDATDAPLMRDRAGRVYIPGSSLRGALRSEMERILAGAAPPGGPSSCILFSEDSGPEACISVDRKKQEALVDKKEDEALAYLESNLCDLCRLFGSPAYASRLTIEDSYLKDDTIAGGQAMVRDGVGIDRDTGAAREGIKFNYEVLEHGRSEVWFGLGMRIENLGVGGPHDRSLLNFAIGLLEQGLAVGGKRSAGLGQIRLERSSLKVTGFQSGSDLWESLQAGRDPNREWPLKEVLGAQA